MARQLIISEKMIGIPAIRTTVIDDPSEIERSLYEKIMSQALQIMCLRQQVAELKEGRRRLFTTLN